LPQCNDTRSNIGIPFLVKTLSQCSAFLGLSNSLTYAAWPDAGIRSCSGRTRSSSRRFRVRQGDVLPNGGKL